MAANMKTDTDFVVWAEGGRLSDLPPSLKCLHVNFCPSAKDIFDLLRAQDELTTVQFIPAAQRRLSASSRHLLELAGVTIEYGRIRDMKYPSELREFVRRQDTELSCQEIADLVFEQFARHVSRQLVWFWRETASA